MYFAIIQHSTDHGVKRIAVADNREWSLLDPREIYLEFRDPILIVRERRKYRVVVVFGNRL